MNPLPIASDHFDSLPMVAIDVATLVAWLSEDFLQSVIHTWFNGGVLVRIVCVALGMFSPTILTIPRSSDPHCPTVHRCLRFRRLQIGGHTTPLGIPIG